MADSSDWNAGSRNCSEELTKEFADKLSAMADGQVEEIHQEFSAQGPRKHIERLEEAKHAEGVSHAGVKREEMYLGVVAKRIKDSDDNIDIGFSAHDGTYNMDFAWVTIHIEKDTAKEVSNYIVAKVREYSDGKGYKFMGAGTSAETFEICPYLTVRLWSELDIVTIIFQTTIDSHSVMPNYVVGVDEIADSMARKCVRQYGPKHQPLLSVGFLNEVEVDVSGKAIISTLEQYENTVGKATWDATMHYAQNLKKDGIRIAFFNSTPQGGGVALMRHALVRFARLLGVRLQWYVPKPKPEVFRITKTNHNILQGVADPEEHLTDEQAETIRSWTENNAKRFWLGEKCPLRPVKEGGAHLVVVDDPQMPYLCKMAKDADPDRPVVFRSHIQVRSDLVDQKPNSPTAKVFDWLWSYAQYADLFVAHPVKAFVPKKVPAKKVAYLPATTDWLDGLNKELSAQDSIYYLNVYNTQCKEERQPQISFPVRDYIVQIARFDPAKGIDTVIKAYGELRRTHLKHFPKDQTPQLVIAGHSAIDDPDASLIYDKTMNLIDSTYPDLAPDISVMRLGPVDQLLNVLMSNAKVALQLSTREGFEVKVSEALHKGVPVIATNAGGIPLQVEHEKSGFLVEPDDYRTVAKHLHTLFTDDKVWRDMSEYAATHVSDEVGTVGNALSWFYLAETLGRGQKVEAQGRWINDLAREKAGEPYAEGEPRLPRDLTTDS